MQTVSVTETINAPISDVWKSIDDYANIDQFNPNLTKSFLINGSAPTGLGAERQCDLINGKNYVREKIVGYETNRRFAVDIYEASVPIKQAEVEFTLREINERCTELTMTMNFEPKFGFLNAVMGPLMKGPMRKSMAGYQQREKRIAQPRSKTHATASPTGVVKIVDLACDGIRDARRAL